MSVEVRVEAAPPLIIGVQSPGDAPAVAVEIHPPPGVVEVWVPGPAGPQGPKGDKGDSGGGGDKHHEHVQSIATSQWTVNHNLEKRPAITVIDSAGTVVQGDVDYVDLNTVVLDFSAPFGGRALCN